MLRIQGQPSGCSAVAPDDIKDHILAQPEAVAYFAIRLALPTTFSTLARNGPPERADPGDDPDWRKDQQH